MFSYCPHTTLISTKRPPVQNDKLRVDYACARNGTTTSNTVRLPNRTILPCPSNHMNGHVVTERNPVLGTGYQIVEPPQEILPRRSKMAPSPDPSGTKTAPKTIVRFNYSPDGESRREPDVRAVSRPELVSQATQTEPPSRRPKPHILSRSPSAPLALQETFPHHHAEEPVLRARGSLSRAASWPARSRYSDSSSTEGDGVVGDGFVGDSAESNYSAVSRLSPAEDYPLSAILIGDSGTGKTCLVARLAENIFVENYDVTVGIDFNIARFELPDGRPIRLQLWDTAGQEKYLAITRSYYRNVMGVAMVYDVTRKESLDNILNVWRKEVEMYAPSDVSVMLVGNKMDLDDHKTITTRVGAKVAAQLGAIFYEVSAKEDLNIQIAFQAFTEDIIENVYSKRNPCLSPTAVRLDHSNHDRNDNEKKKSTCNC